MASVQPLATTPPPQLIAFAHFCLFVVVISLSLANTLTLLFLILSTSDIACCLPALRDVDSLQYPSPTHYPHHPCLHCRPPPPSSQPNTSPRVPHLLPLQSRMYPQTAISPTVNHPYHLLVLCKVFPIPIVPHTSAPTNLPPASSPPVSLLLYHYISLNVPKTKNPNPTTSPC